MSGGVFISYRIKDTKSTVIWLAEVLKHEFKNDAVFVDYSDIEIGEKWELELEEALNTCDVFIAVIGPDWLTFTREGESQPAIFNPDDFVYKEVFTALSRSVPIVTILVDGATLPDSKDLPAGLSSLPDYQFISVEVPKDKPLIITAVRNLLEKYSDIHNYKNLTDRNRFITPDLLTPIKSDSQQVVVGQTISIPQLRDGRFLFIERLMDSILYEFDQFQRNAAQVQTTKIPTFWIGGRSGIGKSVLLVQLLQTMVVDRGYPVYWLDGGSQYLLPLLEDWSKVRKSDIAPPVIFIDDFYQRQKRASVEAERIGELLRFPTPDIIQWPILITTGTSDHLTAFEQEIKLHGFDLWEPFVLETWNQQDQQQLISWYEERTNKKAVTGKAFGKQQEAGLPVSMLFELSQEESMAQLGLRFKGRLEDDLLSRISEILSLNRLYLYPPDSIRDSWTDKQNDDFVKLNQDSDFSIFAPESDAAGQIRLTHPHLSDEIYRAIHPSIDKRQRVDDLSKAFEHAWEYSPDLAVDILGVIAEGHERITHPENGLDFALLLDRCYTIWNQVQDTIDLTQSQKYFAWVNWVLWSSRQPQIVDLFEISPLEQARQFVGGYGYQWAFYWRRLWQTQPGHRGMVLDALGWLEQEENHDLTAWAFVWGVLLEQSESLPEGGGLRELVRQGWEWLAGREGQSDWAFVWRALLEQSESLPEGVGIRELVRLGWEWLAGREERSEWSFVWRALLKQTESLPEGLDIRDLVRLGWGWLGGREERSDWAFVWGALLEQTESLPEGVGIEDLVRLGWEWLAGREERSDWSFVWRALLEQTESLPEGVGIEDLVRLGWEWLAGREERSDWSFVWRALLKQDENLPEGMGNKELVRLGWEWLGGREDRSDWNYIWQALLKQTESLPESVGSKELVRLGWEWLGGREDRSDWNYVWQALLKQIESLPEGVGIRELVRLGWEWLAGREDNSSWSSVWEILIAYSDFLPVDVKIRDLVCLGFDWVKGREDLEDWNYVWRALLKQTESLPVGLDIRGLVRLGWGWLGGREERSDWAFVWGALLEQTESLPEGVGIEDLVRLGWEWLAGREERSDWAFVWGALLEQTESLPEGVGIEDLVRLGWEWLAGREERSEWSFVWRALLEQTESLPEGVGIEDLVRLGWEWLAGREERSDWSFVWRALLEQTESLPEGVGSWELVRLGWEWLGGREECSDWSFVWGTLLERTESLPEGVDIRDLVRLGREWLAGREGQREWAFVWLTLLEQVESLLEGGRIRDLVRLGWQWLAGKEERSEWSHVWEALLRFSLFLPDGITENQIALAGWRWLQKQFNHENWSIVYERYWEAGIRHPEYIALGKKWVLAHKDRSEAYGVGEKILKASEYLPPSDPLVSWITSWLRGNYHNPSWEHVWEGVWIACPYNHSIELVISWLESRPKRKKAVFWVIKTIKLSGNPEFIAILESWLEQNGSHDLAVVVRDGLAVTE